MSLRQAARLRHFIASSSCQYHSLRSPDGLQFHIRRSTQGNALRVAGNTNIYSNVKPIDTPTFLNSWQLPDFTPHTRRFATAADISEPGTSRSNAVLVTAPRQEDMDFEEDVELLSADDAQIQLTERAAEKLRTIAMGESDKALALRIAVESGGCHGYQYKMELTSDRAPDDYQFIHPTHRPASIVVDAVSLGLLKGSTIDYATELIGSSFRIVDNPQAKGSGCGCGVSWEAKF